MRLARETCPYLSAVQIRLEQLTHALQATLKNHTALQPMTRSNSSTAQTMKTSRSRSDGTRRKSSSPNDRKDCRQCLQHPCGVYPQRRGGNTGCHNRISHSRRENRGYKERGRGKREAQENKAISFSQGTFWLANERCRGGTREKPGSCKRWKWLKQNDCAWHVGLQSCSGAGLATHVTGCTRSNTLVQNFFPFFYFSIYLLDFFLFFFCPVSSQIRNPCCCMLIAATKYGSSLPRLQRDKPVWPSASIGAVRVHDACVRCRPRWHVLADARLLLLVLFRKLK